MNKDRGFTGFNTLCSTQTTFEWLYVILRYFYRYEKSLEMKVFGCSVDGCSYGIRTQTYLESIRFYQFINNNSNGPYKVSTQRCFSDAVILMCQRYSKQRQVKNYCLSCFDKFLDVINVSGRKINSISAYKMT